MIGDAPRIEPLPLSELTPDLAAILKQMIELDETLDSREHELLTPFESLGEGQMPSGDAVTAALATMPEIIATMLRHPDLFSRQTAVGIQLLGRGALPPRIRELAILRIAWLCQAPYEWGEHVLVARDIGITRDAVERVTQGPDAPGWTPLEAAVLRAADELYDDAMISDATWAVLAEHFDDRQLIELPMLIGQYQGVAYYQNSLRLRLHNGNEGLKAR